jgi:biotin transport system substrate-specific component
MIAMSAYETARLDTARPFADALWPTTHYKVARALVFAFVGAALLTLSAKVQVPFWPVPMTLQTLVVLLIGAAFGMRLAVATVLLYLAQGALGLPVFANTPPAIPGLAYFLGPTGGFLAGFLVAAAIVGAAVDRGVKGFGLAGIMVLADMALLTIGCTWLALFAQLSSGATGLGFERAFSVAILPFLTAEALKIALAALIVPGIWAVLKRSAR